MFLVLLSNIYSFFGQETLLFSKKMINFATMKKYFALTALWIALSASAQNSLSALVPMPNHVEQSKAGSFVLTQQTTIGFQQKELRFAAETLQRELEARMGVSPTLSSKGDISLSIDKSMKGDEHYRLTVSEDGVRIEGATPRAVFYGVMTLRQMLIGDPCCTIAQRIETVSIDDQPRFAYRALMLDPARHFLPMDDVKHYIDQMAHYKYNVLQLHLTDDQGWRIEIKDYPQLTANQEFYSQVDLGEIIRYAAERHIEIVPELDIPGHTVAVLSAFPELGCSVTDTLPKIVGKTENLMLCASNPHVYEIYQHIIKEVAQIFPSPYIHLGGDEANIERNWAKCSCCQALMKKEHFSKPAQLMIPFFKRMLAFVRKEGKKPILWCELDNIYPPANDYLFPYDKDVTLVTWRNGLTPKCLELTHQYGNPIIMAPGEYCYFDYPQWKGDLPEFNNWGMPVTTLQKSYELDPGYGKDEREQAHIMGVMGTLWGEAIKDIHRATYMTYPRALALAEAGWTRMTNRDWHSFTQRLYPNLSDMMKEGVFFRVPYEISFKNKKTEISDNSKLTEK